MPQTNVEFAIMLFAPLLIGVLLTQILRISLKSFIGIYVMLVAANTAIAYLVFSMSYITPLVIGAIGLLAIMLTAGFLGTRIRTSDHLLVGAGIGLFPWHLDFTISLVYGVIFAGLAFLIAARPKFKNPLKGRFRN